MLHRRVKKDAERGRTSVWDARWVACSIIMGAMAGALLATWTVFVEDTLAHFASNGPTLVLVRPGMFLILFGGVLGWLLSLATGRMLGVRGPIRWLALGLSVISLGALFLGATRVLGGVGFEPIRLLILCAFAVGAIAGAGLRQLLEG